MIVNFGSLNVDYVYTVDHFVLPGETLSAQAIKIYPGGKGLNQSVAVARAGGRVMHVGLYGKEGIFLKDILLDNGVDITKLKFVDVPNGHAIIQVDRNGENSIILFSGTNGMVDKDYIDSICNSLKGNEIILFQNETSEIAYAMKRVKEIGCKIVFNPAPMNEKIQDYPLELVDILIVNETEGKMLSGKENPNDILLFLSQKYYNTKIILTLGADGAWFFYKNTKVYIEAHEVLKTVDTTAAGDTFIGYYLANVDLGLDDEKALNLASKAAAISVTRNGAAISVPYREELKQ